jgi:hypothetical protein
MGRQYHCRCYAHPPFRTVADNGIADFSACGEPDPYPLDAAIFIRGRRRLYDQARSSRPTPSAGHPKKVGAGLYCFDLAAHEVS